MSLRSMAFKEMIVREIIEAGLYTTRSTTIIAPLTTCTTHPPDTSILEVEGYKLGNMDVAVTMHGISRAIFESTGRKALSERSVTFAHGITLKSWRPLVVMFPAIFLC